MTSVHTNAAATAALQTLRSINSDMSRTQGQVSSGFRVQGASDNAAYWSIATTMRSDNMALSAVHDAIGLGSAIIDVTYASLETVKNSLDTLKSLIVLMQSLPSNFDGSETFSAPGVDGKRVIDNYDPAWQSTYAGSQIYALDLEATAAINTARAAIESASFNGVNLLLKEDDGNSLSTSNIATFVIGYGGGAVRTMPLKASDFVLLNKGMLGSGNAEDGLLDGLTRYRLEDGTWTQAGNSTLFTARQNGQANDVRAEGFLFDIDLGMWHQTHLGLDRQQAFDTWLTNMDKQIGKVVSLMSMVGSISAALDGYADFNMKLSDSIERGVSRLVDADMNEASTRLKALQTQENLGIQTLQIANTNSENILQLFR